MILRYGKVGGICFVILMFGGIFKLRCKICVYLEGGRYLILYEDIMNIIFISGIENVSLVFNVVVKIWI